MRDKSKKLTPILNLRVGELVEVGSAEEILMTLDENARLERLPFMPEMLQFCGKRFRVVKRADKTCDTISGTGGRRMRDAVHLEGLRCDGKAHGGCQAACLLFWKEAWLRRVSAPIAADSNNDGQLSQKGVIGRGPALTEDSLRSHEILMRATHDSFDRPHSEEIFSCQATELVRATEPLVWWDIRQYIRDLRSGNVTVAEMVRVLLIRLFSKVQLKRGGCPYPYVEGRGKKTPALQLNLQPGELVEVRSGDEIFDTLDSRHRNRGLFLDVEMVRFCGARFRVLQRVERIVNERTGQLVKLPSDCIVLEGVTCVAHASDRRLFCPRSILPYWREIWLRRVVDGCEPRLQNTEKSGTNSRSCEGEGCGY